MLLTNTPNYAIMTDNDHLKFPHGILLLRITSNLVTCNHLLNHILGSRTHNPLDIRHDLYS